MEESKYTVYILECQEGERYIGMTDNLTKRLQEHRYKEVKDTTNCFPFSVVHVEDFNNKKAAIAREAAIKALSDEDLETLIRPKS